ncbi:hypothetical protein niasHS_000784 [Heterodera schachtii]|uniref:Uncharacterized protein n=2 Tax=Heterodera TaxID=34509 RepID=A0ABD2KIT6_HETSC
MVANGILIFSILAAYKVGDALCLMCKACEGEMCNSYQMSVSCEFPVRQCMRLSDPYSGRVYKMGCVYPYDEMCQQQRMNEQMRCYTCDYDNCNAMSNPYGPGNSPYSNGGYDPYNNAQRYGPNGRYGYYWNGAMKLRQQQTANLLMALIATLMTQIVLSIIF